MTDRRNHAATIAAGAVLVISAIVATACGLDARRAKAPDELPESTGDWRVAQEGSSEATSWRLFVSNATFHGRCLSVALDPPAKPPPTLPPGVPPLQRSAPGAETSCAPTPSLTDAGSQPIYSLVIGQDGAPARFHYIAGLAAAEISEVRVEFDDGSAQVVQTRDGAFLAIFAPNKRIAALRPNVPAFPNLLCKVNPAPLGYADGGCQGYRFKVP